MTHLATILVALSMNILTETDQEKLLVQCIFLAEMGSKAPEHELKYISEPSLEICMERLDK